MNTKMKFAKVFWEIYFQIEKVLQLAQSTTAGFNDETIKEIEL